VGLTSPPQFQGGRSLAVWLIVNPRAGGGRGARTLAGLLPLLEAEGVKPAVHVCADGSEPEAVARRAIADGAEMVVAIGGDGHAAAVAEALIGTPVSFAVVPAGSANDYARALGMRRRPMTELARLISQRQTQQVDVMRVATGQRTRHVLTVGGAGFDARVAERAMAIRRLRGAPRYVAAMLAEMPAYGPAGFAIEVDGQRMETDAMLVAVANGSTYGGGMRVAPGAHLQSGRLEVCVVGDLSRLGFLRAFPRVFRGTHVSHPRVTMLRGQQVDVSADRALSVIGDGELIGSLPAQFRVLPGALAVVAARDAPLA
jgi:diacylglycerol kinase (ATP)